MQKLLILVLLLCSGVSFLGHASLSETLTEGMLVTSKGDTLYGDFVDFKTNLYTNHFVVLRQENDKEIAVDTRNIRMASTEGRIYEPRGYKILTLLYASPNIRLYQSSTNEYVYYFPARQAQFVYTPFAQTIQVSSSADDHQTLADIFADCEQVVQKIHAGKYQLKQVKSSGSMQALVDYENLCGSGNPEKYLKQLDTKMVKNLYK